MTGRRRLGMVAAAATLLSAAPLSSIFESWTWLLQCTLTVLMIAGAAVGARTLRFPTWAQTLSMIVALALALTWIFPSGKEILIPQPATLGHFLDLFRQAGEDTRAYGVPVPDRDGLLFVAVLGIGVVAIAVDLLTAVFRRPALAGLPMLAIYSIPVAVYLDSVPVLPFIVGACGYMWLLVADNVDRVRRFGRRFTGDGRDVDVWEPSPLAAAGRRIGVLGVIVAVLLPLAVPTVSGGLLSQLTQAGSGAGLGSGTGSNGRINLFASLSGQLTQNATINLLKVTTNEPDPFYLRFGVAEALTDEGFGNQTPKGNSLSRGLPDPRQLAASSQANYFAYRAEIEVSGDLRQSMAPLYTYPTGVQNINGNWAYDSSQQVLFAARTTTSEQKYTIDYLRPRFTAAELRTAEALPRNDPLRQYTAAPDDAVVKAQVEELIAGKKTEYDKVRAIYGFFSADNGFKYSLSTQTSGAASEIATFLNTRTGYCQQYAAAMAWMVREAGIPARVAFGFTRGTSLGNGVYQITNRNAHAWTEVYLDGFGWVPFDATPAGGVAGSARSSWAPNVDQAEPSASASAGTTTPDDDSSAAPNQPQTPDRNIDGSNPTAEGATPADSGAWTTALLIVAGFALLVALLLVPAMLRVLQRRRRHAATESVTTVVAGGPDGQDGTVSDIVVTTESTRARADAHAAWDELIDTMVDYQVTVDPTETPRLTAQRLIKESELSGDSAEAATLLGTAEERARYARQPMQGVELTAALGRIRAGLGEAATFRVKARAMLLPPSVLIGWRLGAAEAFTRLAERATTVRDAMVRFSPRRFMNKRATH
ncbi:transglutaminase TgpA family protein [Actinoplanes rectilineatus]|uniref:transglutaminase TgpA family protein n=1 Tax=Actinoplanes rectilineatus TaxID=113571 RepID=UPI0005F2E273|nr:DUF3488 and transglutaminase-like domain-containing protein [Actinoplanes rectilineatus]